MKTRATRSRGPTPSQTLVLAFAGAILVGTVLLRLPASHAPGAQVGWLDALFTATSAVCVTGLVVVDTAAAFSRFGETVIMLLIKAGGLGILSLGVLVALATGRRLGFGERRNLQLQTGRRSVGGVVRFTRDLLILTVAIELAGTAVLYIRFHAVEGPVEGLFYALFHSVSAFNNAGFALYADSLSRFVGDPIVSLTIPLLFIVGGIGIPILSDVAARLRSREARAWALNTKTALAVTALLLGGGTIAVAAMEWTNPATLGGLGPAERGLAAFFQAATPRTAGFNSVDIGGLREGTLVLIIFLMFIGGNPSGTAGGIRTTTFAVLMGSIWTFARGKESLVLFGRRIDQDLITKAGAVATMGVLLCGASLTLLAFTEPELTLHDLLFETVSAMATVGLSTGITPELSAAGRVNVILLMFAGRIGLLTFALALAQREVPQRTQYPREDLIVG